MDASELQEALLSPLPATILRLSQSRGRGSRSETGNGFIKLPYDREVPVELCKKLMQARVDEYEVTGADWSDN